MIRCGDRPIALLRQCAGLFGQIDPALGGYFDAMIKEQCFDLEEREAAAPAVVRGLSFITEGAIPFAAKDPIRVIPSLMLGSAVAGALSMVFNCQLLVPHGGIFAILIPGAAVNLPAYLVAIAVGSLVTAAAVAVLKTLRPVVAEAAAFDDERVAFPVADGVAGPRWIHVLRKRPAVDEERVPVIGLGKRCNAPGAAGGIDRRIIPGNPRIAGLHHADQPFAGERIAGHRQIARLEDVERQPAARQQQHAGQRKDRKN